MTDSGWNLGEDVGGFVCLFALVLFLGEAFQGGGTDDVSCLPSSHFVAYISEVGINP